MDGPTLRTFIPILVVGFALGCVAPKPRIAREPLSRPLELHLADYCEKPVPGRIQVQTDPNAMPLCAERDYFLDEQGLSSASLAKDRIGAPAITLCFTESGRQTFQRVIHANRGRWVVFFAAGKLLMGTNITSGESSECATIEGAVTKEEAAALQAAIAQH